MDDLSAQYLTTRELAALLRIKERKVYELVSAGEVPCSRATGKLLFPRRGVEEWIAHCGHGIAVSSRSARSPIFAGSHDPLLEWALRESRAGLPTYFDGSLDGLTRFRAGEAAAVGMHVFCPDEDSWNTPLLTGQQGFEAAVLCEFAWRQRGLMVRKENHAKIDDVAALAGRRVVARQAEAGSQALLEHFLRAEGLMPDGVIFSCTARNETDAAHAVAEGKAEAAFGLLGVARQFKLDFVPVVRERFDLLIDRRTWFEPPMQSLLRFFKTKAFAERAAETQGYETDNLGHIHFNGP